MYNMSMYICIRMLSAVGTGVLICSIVLFVILIFFLKRFSLQSFFPRETASLCQAKIPASNLLFGDDTDRLVKSAREQFGASQHRGGAHSSQIYIYTILTAETGQGCGHTPSIAFQHLPPNSDKFVYATEGALYISVQLSTDAVSALRKVWVLIIMTAEAT